MTYTETMNNAEITHYSGKSYSEAIDEAIRALGVLIIGGRMGGKWPQPQLEEIRNNLMRRGSQVISVSVDKNERTSTNVP